MAGWCTRPPRGDDDRGVHRRGRAARMNPPARVRHRARLRGYVGSGGGHPCRGVVLVVAGLLLAGCAQPHPSGLTIEFWSGWTGREAKVFQALVDRFNHEHPGLTVHNFGGVTDDTKTVRAITAGV